ncbi:homeotic protein female sterile [Drosophila grimshawi]|nr:homeotic protein female sterile [Drosophila grimshawi]
MLAAAVAALDGDPIMVIQPTLNSMGPNAIQPVQQKAVKRIADVNAFESSMAKVANTAMRQESSRQGSVEFARGNAWPLHKHVPPLAGRAGAGGYAGVYPGVGISAGGGKAPANALASSLGLPGVAARAGGSGGTSKGTNSQGQRGGKGNANVNAGGSGARPAAANATASATTGGGTTNARRTENNGNNASNAGAGVGGSENVVNMMSVQQKRYLGFIAQNRGPTQSHSVEDEPQLDNVTLNPETLIRHYVTSSLAKKTHRKTSSKVKAMQPVQQPGQSMQQAVQPANPVSSSSSPSDSSSSSSSDSS